MIFTPQKYRIPDEPMQPFIDTEEIERLLRETVPSKTQVRDIVAKSLEKHRLTLSETACLINADDPDLVAEIKEGAHQLKQAVYGNRIVLFAPLYIGNKCINDCIYCGFRASNRQAIRKTLTDEELIRQLEVLEEEGQKRLILVYGEHPDYEAEFIAHTVQLAYQVKKNRGAIRRVNINAAPLDIDGFRMVKQAGIGTYQIFQETYHQETYQRCHPVGRKSNYANRLVALDRAQEAGIDDVGIGALLGLYDWRFEVMGLVRHANHLEACYQVGPHTISFPRVKEASGVHFDSPWLVSDSEFARLVAILRLAVPYTGMILTAREPAALRDEVIQYGISQIDGGTKIEIGAYSEDRIHHPWSELTGEKKENRLNRGQFLINDDRTIDEIVDELMDHGMIPSFCTACYRSGRTGEHFMEISVPGFIHRFCTPNALLTLGEYLLDYASEQTASKGWALIHRTIEQLENEAIRGALKERFVQLKAGKRDLYF
jgi:2-iminoacetate synthase